MNTGDEVVNDSAPAPERKPELSRGKARVIRDPAVMTDNAASADIPIVTDAFTSDEEASTALSRKRRADQVARQRAMKTMRKFTARGTKA